jgi:hypothetical protein
MRNPVIGFWGGMALLVSSITGPGLTAGTNTASPALPLRPVCRAAR